MILLIDAFNLIYKIDGLDDFMFKGDLALAMRGLKKIILQYNTQKTKKDEIHIFFDGKRKNSDATKRIKESGLHLYYSHDVSADYLIMQFIKKNANPGNLAVISSDKQIMDFARRHKCKRYTSEEFAELLLKKQEIKEEVLSAQKTGEIDSKELDYWQKQFSNNG